MSTVSEGGGIELALSPTRRLLLERRRRDWRAPHGQGGMVKASHPDRLQTVVGRFSARSLANLGQ